jgi:hypothetical protein
MAGLTLKGTINRIGKVEAPVADNPDFTKRELWLTIDEETEYPQTVNIEFLKDKTSALEKYGVGDQIEVDINVRGNKSKDGSRCFNSLNGWRIRGIASGKDEPQDPSPAPLPDDGNDDLPF